jgi:hypothetical protein
VTSGISWARTLVHAKVNAQPAKKNSARICKLIPIVFSIDKHVQRLRHSSKVSHVVAEDSGCKGLGPRLVSWTYHQRTATSDRNFTLVTRAL